MPVFPPAQGAGQSAVGCPLAPLRSPAGTGSNLTLGDVDDPAEHQAERIAHQIMNASQAAPVPLPDHGHAAGRATPLTRTARTAVQAPGIVHEALRAPGQPLDAGTRSFFEPRFGVDLSRVRVHADMLAARSARAVDARAYTLGDQIVLGAGQYRPGTVGGRALLAHELAHVTASPSAVMVRRQSAAPPADAPRKDYVFIMGADASPKNPFYQNAERYYRAHLPDAVFNTSQRSLAGLLSFLASSARTPIANLYIVSHGSEDGTLQFSLEPGAKDHRLTVSQLRAALHPLTGKSRLTSVSAAVDENTRIHIKGCNIGRTQEMVELLNEAFGGAGTVTAPTHQQEFTPDLTLQQEARRHEHDTRIADFSATLPAVPALPTPVDPALRGVERRAALQERAKEVKERQAVITERAGELRAEERRIAPEVGAAAARAEWVESLAGPMFQRAGTQLFTAEELRPEVDRLYGHLSEDRRKELVQQLVAPDKRAPTRVQQLQQQGEELVGQEGQRVYRKEAAKWRFADPADLNEARHLFQKQLKESHFTPSSMSVTKADGKTDITFTGRTKPPGQAAFDDTLPIRGIDGELDEKELIARGRRSPQVQNPDRYDWRIERTHSRSGLTTQTAVAERVVAYLSHGSLDISPHEHFTKPETNPDFYATSTFEPTKI